ADSVDKDLLGKTDLVVTTTGNINVCDQFILAALKRGAVVCNIGHFDNEIDTRFMRDNWRWEEVKPQVHKVYRSDNDDDFLILLSEGPLRHVGNVPGLRSPIRDRSFGNQVLAQMYLCEKAFAKLDDKFKESALKVEVLPKK